MKTQKDLELVKIKLEDIQGRDVTADFGRFAEERIDAEVHLWVDENNEVVSSEVDEAWVFVIDQDGGNLKDYEYQGLDSVLIELAKAEYYKRK